MTKQEKRISKVVIAVMLVAMLVGVFSSIGVSAKPAGSHYMNVSIDNRDVLDGRVFNINGSTYVPMLRFANTISRFTYSYDSSSKTLYMWGTNLEVIAREGDLYIIANGRYFYTGSEVMLYDGEMYVPIRPLTKALNSTVEWSSEDNKFYVYSGDTTALKNSNEVYNPDDIYWLSRIISAEARGESMKGKIAVGNVILNRVRSKDFPNTIYDVIFDRKFGVQFTPTANGAIYNTPTNDSVIAAKICYEGYSLSSSILYFLNPKYATSSWIQNNKTYVFTIGNHDFYE